jgi:hypothetical protein
MGLRQNITEQWAKVLGLHSKDFHNKQFKKLACVLKNREKNGGLQLVINKVGKNRIYKKNLQVSCNVTKKSKTGRGRFFSQCNFLFRSDLQRPSVAMPFWCCVIEHKALDITCRGRKIWSPPPPRRKVHHTGMRNKKASKEISLFYVKRKHDNFWHRNMVHGEFKGEKRRTVTVKRTL